jgi:hypothetical protein
MNVADSFWLARSQKKRVNNPTILLQALDKYIDDVIATDHRTEFGKLPIIVKKNWPGLSKPTLNITN